MFYKLRDDWYKKVPKNVVAQGRWVGEGRTESLGLVDMNYYIEKG